MALAFSMQAEISTTTSDYDKIRKTDACVTFGQGILQGNEKSN